MGGAPPGMGYEENTNSQDVESTDVEYRDLGW